MTDRTHTKTSPLVSIIYLVVFSMLLEYLCRIPFTVENLAEYKEVFNPNTGIATWIGLGLASLFTLMIGIKTNNMYEKVAFVSGSFLIIWFGIPVSRDSWYLVGCYFSIVLCIIVIIALIIRLNKMLRAITSS